MMRSQENPASKPKLFYSKMLSQDHQAPKPKSQAVNLGLKHSTKKSEISGKITTKISCCPNQNISRSISGSTIQTQYLVVVSDSHKITSYIQDFPSECSSKMESLLARVRLRLVGFGLFRQLLQVLCCNWGNGLKRVNETKLYLCYYVRSKGEWR